MAEEQANDGKGLKETIAEEAKGLALEVYRDGAKPAVKEAGHVVGGITKLLLWPLRKIVDGTNSALDRLTARVEKKLEGVPPERLLPAPATIAGPAALHYAMLGEGDDVASLREMFENLLMASMDSATAGNAHPAFVSVISQMTTDDAWVAKSIDREVYPAFEMTEHTARGKRPLGVFALVGIEAVPDSKRRAACISNLDRLGIIQSGQGSGATREYKELQEVIDREDTHDPEVNTWCLGMTIEVTPFGSRFLDTCVRPKR